MTKKKCCNKLCVNCKNYRKEKQLFYTDSNRCSIAIDQVTDCVTGGKSNIYLIPEKANCNGNCKYYREDEQKILWAELRALAQRYHNEVFMRYHGDYTCLKEMTEGDYNHLFSEYRAVQDLLSVLGQKRTCHDEYADKDEESKPVVKKKKHWWNE